MQRRRRASHRLLLRRRQLPVERAIASRRDAPGERAAHGAAAHRVELVLGHEGLKGATDLAPKPLAQRLREIQAANGRLDITNARLQQGDLVATANGALSLTARGTLTGELRVTLEAATGTVQSSPSSS